MFSKYIKFGDIMEFSEDIFVGGSITDEEDIIFKLKNGEFPTDVYCVCRCPEGKFRYEIMSCRELKKELRRKHFVICGIGGSKSEAFEIFRTIVEETDEFA